jgi:hypothetical protein
MFFEPDSDPRQVLTRPVNLSFPQLSVSQTAKQQSSAHWNFNQRVSHLSITILSMSRLAISNPPRVRLSRTCLTSTHHSESRTGARYSLKEEPTPRSNSTNTSSHPSSFKILTFGSPYNMMWPVKHKRRHTASKSRRTNRQDGDSSGQTGGKTNLLRLASESTRNRKTPRRTSTSAKSWRRRGSRRRIIHP